MKLRPKLVRAAVPAVAALALVAAGCGGGGSKSSSTSTAVQTSTAGGSDAASVLASIKAPGQSSPQRVAMNLSVTVKGDASNPIVKQFTSNGPITASITGAGQDNAADLTYAVKAGAFSLSGGLRTLGGKSWAQIAGQWYQLPASSTASGTSTSSSPKPQDVLAALGDPGKFFKNATVVGGESVAGVPTQHVRGDLDIPAFLDAAVTAAGKLGTGNQVSPSQLDTVKKEIDKAITSSKADIWVGTSDHLIHKLSLDLAGTLTGSVKTQTGISGFDATVSVQSTPTSAVTVTPPAGAKPFSALQSQLGGLLGGLGSLGTGTTP